MQLGNDVGPRQAQEVVVALQRQGVVGEPLAPEIGLLGEPCALDHHAPGAVEHQHPLAGGALESVDAFGPAHETASRTPSTRQMA